MVLKTLKDIAEGIGKYNKPLVHVSPKKLREEAIKWIKELEQEKLTTHQQMIAFECTCKIDWIKEFFNIKEDLK